MWRWYDITYTSTSILLLSVSLFAILRMTLVLLSESFAYYCHRAVADFQNIHFVRYNFSILIICQMIIAIPPWKKETLIAPILRLPYRCLFGMFLVSALYTILTIVSRMINSFIQFVRVLFFVNQKCHLIQAPRELIITYNCAHILP